MSAYTIVAGGDSRSFPADDAFLAGATAGAPVAVYIGGAKPVADTTKTVVLVELRHEFLGEHTGETNGEEGGNMLGFARFRNGDDAPSNLIELVRQKNTPDAAIEAARAVFEAAGFTVAICADQAGRILDRLIRPKYNAALRFLDEGLATQADMDLTCRLGLGYPDGPIERVLRGGLHHHYAATKALFEVYGTPAYAPARRAVVAARRHRP